MWPFKPKTVAQTGKEVSFKVSGIERELSKLQGQIADLEKKIPYTKKHNQKEQLELLSIKLGQRVKRLEVEKEQLEARMK